MIEFILKIAPIFAAVLVVCFALSCLAPMHWFLAFLAQFKVPYAYGALVLAPLLFFSSSWFLLSATLIVLCASIIQVRAQMAEPLRFSADISTDISPTLQIVQYNKYYYNQDFKGLAAWLAADGRDTDVLLMQEVLDADIPVLHSALGEFFPYHSPKNSERPDSLMIYSKTPILNYEVHQICQNYCQTKGARFDLAWGLSDIPVRIYTAHTHLGFQNYNALAQAEQYEGLAEWMVIEDAPYRVFAGDLNTTAHLPVFRKFLKNSGMRYQRLELLPLGTWPRWLFIPSFQVSIDHVLYNQALRLSDIRRGASFGSDHYSLVARMQIAP